MKFNLITAIEHILAATVGSLLAVALLFQAAFYSFTGSAIAADLNSSVVFAANSLNMAEQVEATM